MFCVLSPAKSQNFEAVRPFDQQTLPESLSFTSVLHKVLKPLKAPELKSLMSISDQLAERNYERFQNFKPNAFNKENSKQAIFTFSGDVYRALNANELSLKELQFAQQHLGILSGFYGLLRPLDVIQAYRLEMKTKITTEQSKNLYEFWRGEITRLLNKRLKSHQEKTLVNLASNEYFKAIDPKKLDAHIITIEFKETKNGQLKTIGLFAKYARGLMARYLIQNAIDTPEQLKDFNLEGYQFSCERSDDRVFVFTR